MNALKANAARYDLVIFDWDGTLMDSSSMICDCLADAAVVSELPVLTPAAYQQIIGLGLPEAILALYPEYKECPEQLETMRLAYIDAFSHAPAVSPYRGVGEGLNQLREAGCQLAVATGKSRKGLEHAMSQVEWCELFDTSRCADETRSKPHPLMLEEILAECGVAPERAVMIGDTSFDLAMAEQIGMDRVALHYGAHTPEVLDQHRPIFSSADFSELTEWLLAPAA